MSDACHDDIRWGFLALSLVLWWFLFGMWRLVLTLAQEAAAPTMTGPERWEKMDKELEKREAPVGRLIRGR